MILTYLLVWGIQVIHLQRDTVKPQTIIQQNAVIGTVAVDGWIVTFGTAWGGLKDDTYLLISVGVRGWLCLEWHYDGM